MRDQAVGHLSLKPARNPRRRRSAALLSSALLLGIGLFGSATGCGRAPADPDTIDAQELAARIASNEAPLVLDVRSRGEFEAGHIPGALNIPHDQLEERIGELPVERSTEIVVHCQSGRRADAAASTLTAAGYSNLRDLDGHWAGWMAAGRPQE